MINIEPDNLSNRARIVKAIIVVAIIAGFIIWQRYFTPTLEEETFETALPMTFHGRIDSIYRDKDNHDVKKVILSDGYVYGIYAPWEPEVDLGDSLSKAKGSLQVEVYKKNGQKLILDYKQLAKGFHKAWWER